MPITIAKGGLGTPNAAPLQYGQSGERRIDLRRWNDQVKTRQVAEGGGEGFCFIKNNRPWWSPLRQYRLDDSATWFNYAYETEVGQFPGAVECVLPSGETALSDQVCGPAKGRIGTGTNGYPVTAIRVDPPGAPLEGVRVNGVWYACTRQTVLQSGSSDAGRAPIGSVLTGIGIRVPGGSESPYATPQDKLPPPGGSLVVEGLSARVYYTPKQGATILNPRLVVFDDAALGQIPAIQTAANERRVIWPIGLPPWGWGPPRAALTSDGKFALAWFG